MKMSVEEVLAEIAGKVKDDGSITKNRFNKKQFTKLVNAAFADPEFSSQIATVKKGDFLGYEEIAVGKEFRKWVRKIVEAAGIDPAESGVVERGDFPMADASWVYPFLAEVLWLYLEGNKFDLLPKEDFQATISIKEVPEKKKVAESKKPGTNEVLGTFEVTKAAHKELAVNSKCPSYLQVRREV